MKWICCGLALLLSINVSAEEIANVKRLNKGYTLDINNVAHRALPAADFEKMMELLAKDKKEKQLLIQQIAALKNELNKSLANAEKLQTALDAQSNLNEQYRELNNRYSDLNTKYSNTADELVGLNKDYRAVIQEFDGLTEKYRKVALRTNPRSTWDFGLGMLKPTASGSDPHYFASVGTGAKLLNTEFRGWLLVGDDSYGLMAGLSF